MLLKHIKYILAVALSTFLAVGALTPIAPARAATVLGGNVTTDTTITAAGGPYEVTSSVNVLSGVTLTVEPGVSISAASTFNYGTIFSVSNGGNLIVGGAGASVIFRGATSVLINNLGSANFTNVELLDLSSIGQLGGVGNSINNSEIRSTPCNFTIHGAGFSGNVLKNSTCVFASDVSGNLFLKSPSPTATCALVAAMDIDVSGNEFRGFSNNDALCAGGNRVINATGNFWGITDQNQIHQMVFDKIDDPSSTATVDTSSPLLVKPVNVPEPWAAISPPLKPAISATSIKSTWSWNINVSDYYNGGLAVSQCQLQFRDSATSGWASQSVGCGRSFWHSISNPGQAHFHEIQYRTFNDEGWSPWSDTLKLIYGEAPPVSSMQQFAQVEGSEVKKDSITIAWNLSQWFIANCKGNVNYCPVEDFIIRFSNDLDGPWREISVPVRSPLKLEYSSTIRGLLPAKLYYLQLGAANAAGISWQKKTLKAYTAGTLEQKVRILQSNGLPLINASLGWSRLGGGFTTSQNVKTNDEGWAVFQAVPAGPGTLSIVDAKLPSGLKLQSKTSFAFGRKDAVLNIPAEPSVSSLNVNVRTVDSTGIAHAQVQIQNSREGLPADLSRCDINGFTFILPRGASASVAVTNNEGLAKFYGLVDYSARYPYAVNVQVSAGTINATQSVPLKSSSQGVWFPYLPYVNALWSHFSGKIGSEVPVSLIGHNAVFTPSADASKLPDDQKMSVSVIGPDGVAASCDKSSNNPTAYFDDQGHGQLAFCPRAAGYYQLVGNGILAGQTQLLLPKESVPSIPRSGELLPSRKWSTVTWQVPEFNVDETKMSYSVAFRASGTSKWNSCKVSKLKASCKKFTTGRRYDVAIAAKNKFGWSPTLNFSVTAP